MYTWHTARLRYSLRVCVRAATPALWRFLSLHWLFSQPYVPLTAAAALNRTPSYALHAHPAHAVCKKAETCFVRSDVRQHTAVFAAHVPDVYTRAARGRHQGMRATYLYRAQQYLVPGTAVSAAKTFLHHISLDVLDSNAENTTSQTMSRPTKLARGTRRI